MSKKHERNAEQSAIRRNLPARRLNLLRLSKGSFGGDYSISVSFIFSETTAASAC
jgi:hypothetical protein